VSPVTLTVNGREELVEVAPDTPLLWVLRDQLRLTGTKFACGIAACGACTVLVDGAPARACVLPVSAVTGKRVVTIEGADGRVAVAVQAAWVALDVPQCGYCQSGQVLAAVALLAATPTPSDADVDRAMDGILCRCGTYPRIRAAIRHAAEALAATA
jgi:aerobic-type carbon monoxide dehydrogenase small subunit (CoxS/CutS family)